MHLTRSIFLGFLLFSASACGEKEPRVERVDGSQSSQLPLKFESMFGMRDGEAITAQPLFKDGMDSVQLEVHVRLGPPIAFASGTYRANIGGHMSEGPVVCDSLSFLGGQNALPSVGGTFRLQDNASGHTVFRITMPATPITRHNAL
jgi:hypothetical protein